jgi:hypothetical protein
MCLIGTRYRVLHSRCLGGGGVAEVKDARGAFKNRRGLGGKQLRPISFAMQQFNWAVE